MEVTFYGARGSCPCAGEGYHRYGGNTASVLVRTDGGELIVLDMGTGLRPLGAAISSQRPPGGPPIRATVLLTHLHFDHILGLPFFDPLRNDDSLLDVYGPRQPNGSLADVMGEIVRPPFFPVALRHVIGDLRFHDLGDAEHFAIGDAKIRTRRVRHPGATLGYRVDADGRSLAYVPDHQQASDGRLDEAVLDLCDGVDLLVHDAQYTDFELEDKPDWGHSTVGFAIRLAVAARVGRLVLFHHDPSHDDQTLDQMLERAEAVARPQGLSLSSAQEGATIRVGS